ncbi:MAG: hypothetical protein KDJ52_17160 [Anaerolineae bacterium]|nr:hypothetical protein [Anaerolineae bacterium]MCB0211071.1 hypothetical protein [Anaerolineae bacterium]
MLEGEPKSIAPRPEDVFTAEEAELLHRTEQGEILCWHCGQPLWAEKLVTNIYEGIVLFCSDPTCEFVEY